MEKRLSPDEQEQIFQDAYDRWEINPNDKKALEIIWLRIYEACKANAKRILKVSISDDKFHDRLMDAVMTCYRYIVQEHKRPEKLGTYCYLPTLSAFCGYKAIREDKELSYEQSVSNGYDVAVDILGNRDYGYQTKYIGEDDD